MAIMRFNFRSQVLSGYVDVSIVYPTDFLSYYDMSGGIRGHQRHVDRNYPVYQPGMKFQTIYLIHGGGDDDSLTYRYTNAELYAQKNYCMLVTPNICNSFGIDTAFGVNYSTFLTEELPLVIRSLFASSPAREDNFIMGYAMGGNVALGTALKRPDLFQECIDISGGIGWTMDFEKVKRECSPDNIFRVYANAFGPAEQVEGTERDLRFLAHRNLQSGAQLPKLTFIRGSLEGEIGEAVDKDCRELTALGYDTKLIVEDGYNHYFPLWDKAVGMAINELLPLKRAPIYE